jgi:hypothetical protein
LDLQLILDEQRVAVATAKGKLDDPPNGDVLAPLELEGDLVLSNGKVSLEDRKLTGDVIRVDALGLQIKIRLPECPGGEDGIHGQTVD